MASTAYPMTPSISMLHDRMDTEKEKIINNWSRNAVSCSTDDWDSRDNYGTERRRKRPPNTGSQLLDNQENYRLFELLGSNNVSLYAAVVELLTVDSQRWRRFARGVISLVKDYENRAYYLRLYDLIGVPELIWEFRLYKNFQSYMTPKCNQLLTFEGEFDGQVFGLNFSSPDEARSFKGHLDKRYEQERKTMAAREPRSTLPQASSVFSTAPPPPPPAATLTASPFTNGVTPVGTIAHHSEKTPVSSGTSSFFRKNKKKDKKPRIRKEDISNPTNFQHKAHVGWDQDSGFSNNVDSDPMDESIKNIIRAAGQDPNNLSKKTIKFVYDFIERYEENTTSDPNTTAQFSRHQAPPPPVPISQPISQWAAPPPPPPSRGASYAGSTAPPSRPPPPPPGGPGVRAIHARPLPQVPPSVQETRPHAVPPPPPPPSLPNIAPVVGGPSVPPAPPPPPPLSSTAPAAPPPPPSLSSSMPPPPPPSLSAVPPPQSGRGDLLAQIQAGKQLRSVTTNAEKKAASASGADARGDVMAQIRLGANLKKVDHAAVEQEKRKSAPTLADMGGIAGALAKALEERRMNMCIDDSSDDDESDEKNEWSD